MNHICPNNCLKRFSISRLYKFLKIENCPNLMTLLGSMDNLTLLQALTITEFPNLTSLPQGIRSLTSLKRLKVDNCPNLMALPEWIGNLTSLEELIIRKCLNLTSLSQGIHDLPTLQRLMINDCPILQARCLWKIGEDWPKISHVPVLRLS